MLGGAGGAAAPAAPACRPTPDPTTATAGGPGGRPATLAESIQATRRDARPGARRGPEVLGRHVMVGVGDPAPDAWAACAASSSTPPSLAAPSETVRALRDAAGSVVIELACRVRQPARHGESAEQYELGPGFTFELDELHWLVWANSIDARDASSPRWAAVAAAVALGARPTDAGVPGDVVLPDGRSVWLDGGPIRHLDPVDGAAVLHTVQLDHRRLDTPGPNITTAELAPDQSAAVTHAGGTARIIAPAGLRKDPGAHRARPARARAVGDCRRGRSAWWRSTSAPRRRCRRAPPGCAALAVRTLNAIALAIVNGSAPFGAQPRQWRTIDEPDVRRILQRFVQSPKKLNVDPLAPWIDALSLVRLGLVDPIEVEGRYGGDVDGLAEVWPLYRDALDRQGVVDFDDQVRRAIDVLLTQPSARRAAQRACRMLLVDEFQDLTPAHVLLVRLLTARGGAVFGVGDDDQTIYGYNGADPAWLIDFGTWFPGAGDHPLEVNYRCPAGVVEIADRLLRHNRRRVSKTIRAASVTPGGWTVDASADPVEASLVAVRAALATGAPASDIAVLTRVNATLTPVQLALTMAGVPFVGGLGTDFVERTAVRAALAWLRLASGRPFEPDDLGEALRRPSRALHPRIREWVGEQRDVDALLRLAGRVTNDKDATRITEFAGDIGRLQAMAAARADTATLLRTLVDEVGLGGAVATLDGNRRGMNRTAQGDDLLALRQAAVLHAAAPTFERWLRDTLATRRDPSGVVLATVHRVKGQEWPFVVVHLAAGDQFPHRLADDHEEERRLFHVAITRASQHVTIVAGDRPSPFVTELTTEPSEMPARDERAPQRVERGPAPEREREQPDHPLLDRDRVMAVVGLVLVDQGHEWHIIDLEPAAAVAERNGATRKFALGEKVETAGRQRGPLRPRVGEVDEASVVLFDLLRQFRERVRNGKPAYTVFDDKTLVALASALPGDLAALAGVKGVGPAKLEQYGDEVLGLVAMATAH